MNKTYVITGATSGIGLALVKALADENIVFAGYRNPKNVELLETISSNVRPIYVDYTKPETIKIASEQIVSEFPKIDTLINIAGCVVAGPVAKLDMNEVRRQFNVNVFGHLELSQRLMNALDGGRIINISSMASYGIFPFIAPYCASKKCLDIFFNTLLIENKKNVKIISVKPGVISTPLWSKSIDENSKYFDQFGEYAKEMEYIMKNAKRNEEKGLSVNEVVKVVLKADKEKNPKLSYTVGIDAFFARIAAKLPQAIINKLIRIGIKLKTKSKKD